MSQTKQGELRFWRGGHLGEASRPGRREGPNPNVRHRSRRDVAERLPTLVTLKVKQGIGSLRGARVVREIEGSFRKACERADFRLVHYSIQRNHAHLIVEADDEDALGRGMMSIAARFSRAINRVFQRRGRVLADRYHHRVLKSPRQVRNALAYVLLNARRHAAERIARLRAQGRWAKPLAPARLLDGASSARWFDGWRTDARLDRAPAPGLGARPAVALPRTWLLQLGWRLHHPRIDPSEIPGGAHSI
jgi:REP element-mobilizing transposase RayT